MTATLQPALPDDQYLARLVWHAVDSARRLSVRFLLSKTTPDSFRAAAGEGAFACSMVLVELLGNEMPIIEAHTWLSSDQMSRLQELEVVVEGRAGDRFDDVYSSYRREWCVPPMYRSRRELGRRAVAV
jgi:hypothetical protein